ncbi:jg19061 [Pararge aegeria aegeria]|uniref:Jg19061 protein n=1 Tax=Pararge aegeria aegeria TaxID=348720 RepID=A0A8S4SR05_9NEOP|nr:jg19061 [Pararge aegeria aegeria]
MSRGQHIRYISHGTTFIQVERHGVPIEKEDSLQQESYGLYTLYSSNSALSLVANSISSPRLHCALALAAQTNSWSRQTPLTTNST